MLLADGVRVEGVEIRDTLGSGLFGEDVGDIAIADVSIQNANAGRLAFSPFLPHGGVTPLTSPEAGSQNAVLRGVRVLGAAGSGILTLAAAGSEVTLSLLDVEVTGGTEIGPADYGVAAFARGPGARVSLEMIRSTVSGRMSRVGRNVMLLAGDHGAAHGLIHCDRTAALRQVGRATRADPDVTGTSS